MYDFIPLKNQEAVPREMYKYSIIKSVICQGVFYEEI